MLRADRATATFIDWPVVFLVLGVLDRDMTLSGKQPAVARVPGRHDAIKHVDAPRNAFHKVFRGTDTHQVPRLVFREVRLKLFHYIVHDGIGFSDGQPPNGIAGKTDLDQPFSALLPQFRINAALNNSKQVLADGSQLSETVAAPTCPFHGSSHRLRRRFRRRRVGQAIIKGHDDVRAKSDLQIHGGFGSERVGGSVEMRLEHHPVFADFPKLAEAEYLIPAAIRENGTVPFHESMQPAKTRDRVLAWPKHQMIRVTEQDLDRQRLQLLRRHALNGALGPDWHEHGRFHDTVSQV